MNYENKTEEDKVYTVLEYCKHGDLFDFILAVEKKGKFIPENIVRYYFHQLVDAISYLHDKGFAHRDIKLQNILVNKEYNLKIFDFNLAMPLFDKNG